jgi:diguanylate cyclase
VVEFHFSRAGVERNLTSAKGRIYQLTAAAGLVLYLAILPLLARIAKRVPLPTDPARKAALAELETALTGGELILHYQPKIDLSSGVVAGVEALVRWNHPRKGLLSPAEFLPLAESSPDLLAALTYQVLDRAMRDCAAWLRDGRALPVAVNVAAPVLLEQPLGRIVRETLERYSLEPGMLTLEFTESALMEPGADVTAPLADLRSLGISVSMDDFGTGHSSLARLHSLPLDELKLDQSFIAGIAADARDLRITRLIVALGIDLGLRVVAEGVEDKATLDLLRELGCSVAQGFYPVTAPARRATPSMARSRGAWWCSYP